MYDASSVVDVNAKLKQYNKFFCGCSLAVTSTWLGGFTVCVVLCPGAPEGTTGSDSDFKSSQKTGPRLKVSSDRL